MEPSTSSQNNGHIQVPGSTNVKSSNKAHELTSHLTVALSAHTSMKIITHDDFSNMNGSQGVAEHAVCTHDGFGNLTLTQLPPCVCNYTNVAVQTKV